MLLNKSVLGYGNEMEQESCNVLKVVPNVCFLRYILYTSLAYCCAQCLLSKWGRQLHSKELQVTSAKNVFNYFYLYINCLSSELS